MPPCFRRIPQRRPDADARRDLEQPTAVDHSRHGRRAPAGRCPARGSNRTHVSERRSGRSRAASRCSRPRGSSRRAPPRALRRRSADAPPGSRRSRSSAAAARCSTSERQQLDARTEYGPSGGVASPPTTNASSTPASASAAEHARRGARGCAPCARPGATSRCARARAAASPRRRVSSSVCVGEAVTVSHTRSGKLRRFLPRPCRTAGSRSAHGRHCSTRRPACRTCGSSRSSARPSTGHARARPTSTTIGSKSGS